MRRTALWGLLILLLGASGFLALSFWQDRGTLKRPDFQAVRDEIAPQKQELVDAQAAVVGLTKQLRATVEAAEADRMRARALAATATAQATEVIRLRANLRDLEARPRPPAPTTLTEGVRALTLLGF